VVSSLVACRKDEFAEDTSLTATSIFLTESETFPGQLNLDSILKQETIGAVPFPSSGSYNCNIKPIFKDSILYNTSGSRNDYIVKPDNKPGEGKYYSWPMGMLIDSLTGEINVSASQGGIRYTIGFVKKGSRDTCLQNLILSGAWYKDSVYVLGKNDTLAFPFFNADPSAGSICDASGDDDYQDNSGHGNGNAKCEFDAEDYTGKKGRANGKHVKVRTISGIINLKKTLEEGAFGTVTPANGQSIIVPVFYKLNDKGAKALQKLNIQLIYYNTQADVPVALLDYIERKKLRIRNGALITPNGSPRPPLIVITRS
jgi:hypothetical protein